MFVYGPYLWGTGNVPYSLIDRAESTMQTVWYKLLVRRRLGVNKRFVLDQISLQIENGFT